MVLWDESALALVGDAISRHDSHPKVPVIAALETCVNKNAWLNTGGRKSAHSFSISVGAVPVSIADKSAPTGQARLFCRSGFIRDHAQAKAESNPIANKKRGRSRVAIRICCRSGPWPACRSTRVGFFAWQEEARRSERATVGT